MSEMLHCHHCGDPIGVYEPSVALVDGRAQETSRAAHDRPDGVAARWYHRACYLQLGDGSLPQ